MPHGYEGQGPEHSSARLERFLQMCAEDNIQVVYPTTPAQYFHLLRRQVKRNFRKPLVVMTPKSLLRLPAATSPVSEFADRPLPRGARRRRPRTRTSSTRVLLCSGKVYYDLAKKRDELKTQAVALVRLEQLYPWPEEQLAAVLGRYRRCREWVWVQEESQNMGGWSFVEPRLRAMGFPFEYVGRDASASPATGSHHVHEREQELIVEGAFAATPPGAIGPGFVGWVESTTDDGETSPRRARSSRRSGRRDSALRRPTSTSHSGLRSRKRSTDTTPTSSHSKGRVGRTPLYMLKQKYAPGGTTGFSHGNGRGTSRRR